MWSSPVLLLVLVFTLTSATTSKTSPTIAATTQPRTTTTTFETRTVPTTVPTTTRFASPVVTTVPTTEPTPMIDNNYSSVTRSTAKPVASVPNANAMNGALTGTLGPTLVVVAVPLRGPGTWTLTSSASTSQILSCGSVTSPVTSQVVVGDAQICQLEITSTSGEASTWQLTPTT